METLRHGFEHYVHLDSTCLLVTTQPESLLFVPTSGSTSEKFKEINQAYEVLKDSEKRKIYDQVLQHDIPT